jgi:nucleotide-binding universal stress UspA family protein
LEAAKSLARRWNSSLKLVHIEDMPFSFGPALLPTMAPHWWPWADYHRWREEKLRKHVVDFPAARLKVLGIPGWPPDALIELARTKLADLVVMGTHGYAGLDRALFGSIAEAVVRRALVPVLAIHRRTTPFRVRHILAPWNGRPYATMALRLAAEWAKNLCASLDVLYVAPPWIDEKRLEPRLRLRLESVLGQARSPRWDLRLRRGDSRDVVLKEASPERCDLVVLSAHRRPVSSDFVLGSTVERLLRHSRVPILSVPSTAPRRPPATPLPPEVWLERESFL